MCGRFVLATPPDRLAQLFGAVVDPAIVDRWRPSWNVAPGTDVLGLVGDRDGVRLLRPFYWGFIPPGRNPSAPRKPINARAETLADKGMFRKALVTGHRVALPADGYWEWRAASGRAKRKQPFFFHRPDDSPLALAGIYRFWHDDTRPTDDPESWVPSCAVVTTDAPSDLAMVHDRMPAILGREALEVWLDRESDDAAELVSLLRPASEGALDFYPVGGRVGNVANDDSGLIERIAFDVEASA